MAGLVIVGILAARARVRNASDQPATPSARRQRLRVTRPTLGRERDFVEVAVMLGPLIMVLVLVVGLPVAFLATGTVLSVVLGQTLWRDGEDRHRGSELVSLNR
ncbi:MAG: hypothetical protein ACR2MB_02570 [Acidimicrobiales bacterium]